MIQLIFPAQPPLVKLNPQQNGRTQVNLASFTKNVRAADAKEVGVGNPAEETYCHPNKIN
jgi:hypothetical protein